MLADLPPTLTDQAIVLFDLLSSWRHLFKSKFDEFENLVLKNANVIKYNGEDKIYPIRIEDLDGNIIWKK